MIREKIFFSAALTIFMSLPVSAQEAAPAIFAPFVTRLEAEVKNNLVRLSWLDSQDARGPVYIYRSVRAFDSGEETRLTNPIPVPYGVQVYVDETDLSGTLYYFVAASDETGQRYDIFIPAGNMAVISVSGEGTPSPVEPGVFGLEARADGNRVLLNWRSADPSRNLILYRSVRPLRRAEDLLGAIIVQAGPAPVFADYPAPGIPYYYALVFEDELAGGSPGIFPGSNATAAAVEVRSGTAPAGGEMRSIPLPLISVSNAVRNADASSEIAPVVPLSPESAKALEGLAAESRETPLRHLRAFSQDLTAPAGGEESILRAIVQGPLANRDWKIAEDELKGYLAIPRPGQSEARARFYLGQVLYFSGNYREALMEFLAVHQYYPGEANEWMEEILLRLIRD